MHSPSAADRQRAPRTTKLSSPLHRSEHTLHETLMPAAQACGHWAARCLSLSASRRQALHQPGKSTNSERRYRYRRVFKTESAYVTTCVYLFESAVRRRRWRRTESTEERATSRLLLGVWVMVSAGCPGRIAYSCIVCSVDINEQNSGDASLPKSLISAPSSNAPPWPPPWPPAP